MVARSLVVQLPEAVEKTETDLGTFGLLHIGPRELVEWRSLDALKDTGGQTVRQNLPRRGYSNNLTFSIEPTNMSVTPRWFIITFAVTFFATCCRAQEKVDVSKLDPAMAASKAAAAELVWYDVTEFGVEGRILPDQERKSWFDRLPKSAEGVVPNPVWNLSRDSAGMMVRFKTDATAIEVYIGLVYL